MKKTICDEEIEMMEKVVSSVEVSKAELREKYGDLLKDAERSLGAMFPQSKVKKLVELGTKIRLKFDELGLLDIESWVPELPAVQMAFAQTRGIEEAEKEGDAPKPWHAAVYSGKGCQGRMLITEDKGERLKFYFLLEDDQKNEIRPIYLTVKDSQGDLLRERTRLAGKEQPVSDVPVGNYHIILADETGDLQVQMRIEAA